MEDQLRLAGCILTESPGKVLLIHRHKGKRLQWEIPGGKIDEIVNGKIVRSGATPEATVVREMKEELLIDVEVIRRLGAHEVKEDDYTMQFAWYLGKIVGGTPTIGEPDVHDDLRAFTQAEMHAMRDQLSGNTKNFLNAWVADEFSLS